MTPAAHVYRSQPDMDLHSTTKFQQPDDLPSPSPADLLSMHDYNEHCVLSSDLAYRPSDNNPLDMSGNPSGNISFGEDTEQFNFPPGFEYSPSGNSGFDSSGQVLDSPDLDNGVSSSSCYSPVFEYEPSTPSNDLRNYFYSSRRDNLDSPSAPTSVDFVQAIGFVPTPQESPFTSHQLPPTTSPSAFPSPQEPTASTPQSGKSPRKGKGATRVSKPSPLKKHPCPYEGCPHVATCQSNLDQHMTIHTGSRPYRCQQSGCQSTFARTWGLARHYMEVHKMEKGTWSPIIKVYPESTAGGSSQGLCTPARTPRRARRIRKQSSSHSSHTSAPTSSSSFGLAGQSQSPSAGDPYFSAIPSSINIPSSSGYNCFGGISFHPHNHTDSPQYDVDVAMTPPTSNNNIDPVVCGLNSESSFVNDMITCQGTSSFWDYMSMPGTPCPVTVNPSTADDILAPPAFEAPELDMQMFEPDVEVVNEVKAKTDSGHDAELATGAGLAFDDESRFPATMFFGEDGWSWGYNEH